MRYAAGFVGFLIFAFGAAPALVAWLKGEPAQWAVLGAAIVSGLIILAIAGFMGGGDGSPPIGSEEKDEESKEDDPNAPEGDI